jgi:hypothetical protein
MKKLESPSEALSSELSFFGVLFYEAENRQYPQLKA